MKKIFIIAGEASGDLHGANLIHALREKNPSVVIYGVGGDKIKATGALEFFDLAHFHVTGISQAILKIPQYVNAKKKILSSIRLARPDVVVLIDNPGFNLILAKAIHALGIPVVYYITPQIWAWKRNRIYKIKKYCSKVLVVFDFEKALFEEEDIPVAFVGHPLMDLMPDVHQMPQKENSVVLLPGSRKHEVNILLPYFLKAAAILKEKHPELIFKLVVPPTLTLEFYDSFLEKSPIPVVFVEENAYEEIAKARLAIACSGTATLECALLKTPMVIANKGSLLTYVVARAFLKIPYLGLPNIILNRMAFPELMQNNVTPEKLSLAADLLLTQASFIERSKKDLAEISEKLGYRGASSRAAEEILKNL